MVEEDYQLGDAPIQLEAREQLRAIALAIDDFLNGKTRPRKWAFLCIMTEFGTTDGRANYISNAPREDVVVMLREQLRRFEGQAEPPTGHA